MELLRELMTRSCVSSNTMIYEVEFPELKEYAANVIDENMLTQVDSDGFSLTMLEGIIHYRKDESLAVSKTVEYLTTTLGHRSG